MSLFGTPAGIFSKTILHDLYAWLISACGVSGPWGWEIILACYQQNRLQPSAALLVGDKVGYTSRTAH